MHWNRHPSQEMSIMLIRGGWVRSRSEVEQRPIVTFFNEGWKFCFLNLSLTFELPSCSLLLMRREDNPLIYLRWFFVGRDFWTNIQVVFHFPSLIIIIIFCIVIAVVWFWLNNFNTSSTISVHYERLSYQA